MKNNTLCVSSDEDEKGKEKKTEKYRDCVISRRIAGIPPAFVEAEKKLVSEGN